MTHIQKRNRTPDPFRKLFYEILNRFHESDTDKAIELASEPLSSILSACREKIWRNERLRLIAESITTSPVDVSEAI